MLFRSDPGQARRALSARPGACGSATVARVHMADVTLSSYALCLRCDDVHPIPEMERRLPCSTPLLRRPVSVPALRPPAPSATALPPSTPSCGAHGFLSFFCFSKEAFRFCQTRILPKGSLYPVRWHRQIPEFLETFIFPVLLFLRFLRTLST